VNVYSSEEEEFTSDGEEGGSALLREEARLS
jgi:hypothetical protein